LGNPGREYLGTRHNVGYELLDALARRLGWIGAAGEFERLARSKFDGLVLDGQVGLPGGDQKLLLLKPTTYMNLSGQSVQAAMAFYQLTPPDLLVAVDDLALPLGRLRLRAGGSHGGHKGLRDIERALGTSQYPRLRVGIGAAPGAQPWSDYVLSPMGRQERLQFEPAVARGVDAVMAWLNEGVEAAMNRYNATLEETKNEE
jgi:PTH1 family peptidyl-tRNA hydrolase